MNELRENIDEEELDRFEAYYFGTLSDQQMRGFDADLAADSDMRVRYRVFALAMEGIRTSRPASRQNTDELRTRLARIDTELDAAPAHSRRGIFLAIAAVCLLALGIWWLLIPSQHERLADEFTLPEVGLPVLMHTDQQELDRIMNAYKGGHFTEAGDLLAIQLLSDPRNDTLHYYAGVVAEHMLDHKRAITHYDQADSDLKFSERAAYRKAICLLRTNDIAATRTILSSLQHASDPQLAERSRALLERL